jgi:5,10-methylenetetrahydromethanopterin reductase
MTTTRISIGSGVTNPLTREPSVIASAFATLDELAPGRIELGIGSGDSALRTIGKRAATMARFEEVLIELSRMLLGYRAQDDQPGIRLAFPRRVPVLVSATGPRGLRLAARVADGVILHFLTADPAAVARAKQTVREEAERIGRDLSGFRFIGWIPGNIDQDPERARAGVRVHVARHLLTPTATPTDVDTALVGSLRAGYRYEEHMHPRARHAELVPSHLVERFALAGPPPVVADRLAAMLESGFDHLVIVPRGDFRAVATAFVEDVLPRL